MSNYDTVTCDACGKIVEPGTAVHFENTPDGGYLVHRDCYEVAESHRRTAFAESYPQKTEH